MAGLGSRFSKAGYLRPKPFIDVNGKPMIERVLENLQLPDANYILIANKLHIEKEKKLAKQLTEKYNVKFIEISKVTEGTACTILFARNLINNSYPLLIANSDQIIDIKISQFIEDNFNRNLDGSILTFVEPSKNPKWSYAKLNSNNLVELVKEKKAISDIATVGIYLFTKGSSFVDAAIEMIINNYRVNSEIYSCPVYNYCIKKNKKICIYNIESSNMNGLGTPEDLKKYLKKIN